MAKNREAVTCNGRAAFYAAMWDDIRQCAMDCGWAVALHGSLNADMDIMAMPWVKDAASFAELVKKIRLLFQGNHIPGVVITYNEKPHGRIVATIPIWADFYLDISTMDVVEVERYNDLREAFVDYACSGVQNLAPYCKNRCVECVDSRGWCIHTHCNGFNPDGNGRENG